MSKKRCELKKGTFIFIGIFILVSAITLVSAARLPTDGGDSGTWGGIMNTFLNVSLNESGELRSGTVSTSQITDDTITDTDISDTTNLTLGEKITFTLGEVIDNIVNGWITITGGLNVTNNLEVNGSAVFYGGNFSVDTSDLFVDVSTGRVGIGTTSPTTALDVEGSVRISGDIVFSDDSTQPYAATPDGFSWQITSASFKQNKSISSQDGNPVGLFFRTDGKKMYMMGGDGIDVNEYNLSTAWDINTSTFNQNFSVSGEDILPKDLFFRPDGKKMYFGGNDNDAIFEYDLSTAWDVSTLSINQNFSVASEETAIRAMFFRSDGFKIYITGNAGDAVYEYNLSTAWDINTSTFNQNFSIATEDGVPVGLFFKPDGKKMYLLGSSDDDINEYDLSTPWDISTAFFNKLFSVQTEDTQPRALFFNPDGSKMYFAGETGDDINEYDMGLVIGGKVGINVTSPTQVLDVGGNVNISGVYYGNGSGLTDIGTSSISDNSITSVKIAADTINGTELADTITLDATMNIISNDFSVNTSDLFVDVSTGRVGIGTTTPSEKLNVSGNIGASGNVTATYFFGNGSQLTDIDGSNIQPDSINGTELADTITLDAAMNFVGQDFAVNTSDLFVDVSTGRIGIGTTTPTQKLDVVGNISVGSYDNIFGTYENVKILNTLESLDTIDGVGTEVLFTFSKMGLFSVGQTYPASTSSSQTISSNKDYGDLTDFSDDEDHLEFFLYISNASAMGSTLVAELGNTQDSAEYQWTLASSQGFPTLADGWNKVVLRMGSASKGSVDWSTGVDHFRIIYTGTGTNPEFNFSIDDLRMTSNRKASVSRDLVLNDALIVFGNVSIGTNSSTEKLTVFGDLNVTGTSYLGDITINADNITVNGIVSKDGNITFYDSSGGEKVRITNDGKMGIGTTSPTQKLDVNGNIKSSESYVFYDGSTQTIASTPNGFSWHVGSASFNQISPNLQSDDQFISGIFFKPDGTKMYITGAGDDEVNEYDLSTIWDISTASLNQILNTSTQGSSPQGIFFKPDGTKMFVVDSGDDEVNEYDLSTAWDISTTSFSRNFNVSSQDTTPRDLFFKPDGTKMYIVGEVNDSVQEYDLSTVWDISTASFNQNFSVATEDANPRGLSFKPDGTKMYVVGASGRDVNEYDLSIPWNISTATFKQLFSVNSQETSPTGVFFRADGTKMYIVGGGSDSVNEYDLGLIINGKVGIGTTSPTTELEVNGTVTVVGDLNVTGTSYLSDVTLTSDNITVNGIVSKDGNITFYDSSGGEKVRITSEGDVGIGTSSPSSLFDVAGDINTLTDYNIGGTQVLSSTALGSGVVSSSLTSVGSLSSLDMGGDISMNNKQIRFNGGSGNNFLQGNVENTGRLGIFTDDTERITILLGGNVGIGTVSPSS
ncbi:MAG: beta-propeller fold lactonase family protein, partial [Nanoarchaeota archaeon]|nr:beta-propeller fold lactonase family protein [Nanoarchaeota archaeon]